MPREATRSSGASLARSSAAPITWEPSLWALNGDNSPMKRPSGVRAAVLAVSDAAIHQQLPMPERAPMWAAVAEAMGESFDPPFGDAVPVASQPLDLLATTQAENTCKM